MILSIIKKGLLNRIALSKKKNITVISEFGTNFLNNVKRDLNFYERLSKINWRA
jgi:hypothetical protein